MLEAAASSIDFNCHPSQLYLLDCCCCYCLLLLWNTTNHAEPQKYWNIDVHSFTQFARIDRATKTKEFLSL